MNMEFTERVNMISINPEMATIQDIVNMAEALQKFYLRDLWNPASEPPEMSEKVNKISRKVELITEAYYSHHYKQWVVLPVKKGWRELPEEES